MREDVLKVIKSAKDVTNAVILTHNIDFVFVQSVVVPALRKCGGPALTIFADAQCAAETYQYQARVLSELGLRYRVVPVVMEAKFRFHPKALLLSGSKSATLLVGSGNLSFGGWRENGEVWCRYDAPADGTRALAAFRSYLRDVVRLCRDAESVLTSIEEAFDPRTREWASNLEEPGVLLGRAGVGRSLLDQMRTMVGDGAVDELYVCAPYFDEDGEALRTLSQRFDSPPTSVFVQSKRTNLRQSATVDLAPSIRLKATTYEHREKAGPDAPERVREALLHAKFYAVRRGDAVEVFAGSGNCSRAALTIPGSAGNAELMAHRTLSTTEFQAEFLDELVVTDAAPTLVTAPPDDEPPPADQGFISIRAARFEAGSIRVAFEADDGTSVVAGEVDGAQCEPADVGERSATFKASGQPRTLVLVGLRARTEVRSLPHWIDNESALRTTARGRSLADSIEDRVRGDAWNIGAWTDVLSELCKHLQYMPKAVAAPRRVARTNTTIDGPGTFAWADVFSDTYGLPVSDRLLVGLGAGAEGRVGSLRAMVLRWFGVTHASEAELEEETTDASDIAVTDDGGEGGDRVAKLPRRALRSAPAPASDKERNRALKMVGQVAARLADPVFLSERPPQMLAADLKVAAALLRAGRADGWLTEPEFFCVTMTIWLPLFFNARGKENTGWLEQRWLTAPDPDEFVEALRSVELAAALGTWAMSTPAKATSAEQARFELATALGVARLPWLWQAGGNQRIAKEIAEVLLLTSPGEDIDWRDVADRWLTLIRRGYALNRLEHAISSLDLVTLRARIQQAHVAAGELLWQVGTGFCIAKHGCARTKEQRCSVLVLQQGRATKTFSGAFLMPVEGLLGDGVLDDTVMPPKARRELAVMVDHMRVGLSACSAETLVLGDP